MGATGFGVTEFGKDARDAFRTATEQARYSNGHDGYTGTIAEKQDFVTADIKAHGLTQSKFYKAVQAYEDLAFARQDLEFAAGRTKFADRAKLETKIRRSEAKLSKLAGDAAGFVVRMAEAADDKWGPAVCVKITGKKAQEMRERRGLKGRKGDFFHFFGLASC